jgi:hypothetical protein
LRYKYHIFQSDTVISNASQVYRRCALLYKLTVPCGLPVAQHPRNDGWDVVSQLDRGG